MKEPRAAGDATSGSHDRATVRRVRRVCDRWCERTRPKRARPWRAETGLERHAGYSVENLVASELFRGPERRRTVGRTDGRVKGRVGGEEVQGDRERRLKGLIHTDDRPFPLTSGISKNTKGRFS